MTRRSLVPVLTSIAAVLVAVGLGAWLLAPGPSPSVLSSDDRAVLGGPDVERGDLPPAVGYPVPDGADAVARAYLVAAYAAGPSDAGRTRLDAARYAEPGSPPAVVGVTVVDAPPPGARRVAAVEQLTDAASDPDDTRRAFLATVRTTTGAPGESAASSRLLTRVVVHRQPDGRWLVVAETPDTPDTPALPAGDG
ncbi:hypothetical protein [Pseudonocardia endophytica]|uniref:Mce-associated membrane protein n=1 Tax=Pseudonocardia endophytica TaxID=401976 RepID=A0A4R1I140_PSEEN|nr:hypothetical protein [Pseudonocardia endophytica]TCK26940.1 hypothetical protein EV378_2786 [Pseudonocardia endophytica]